MSWEGSVDGLDYEGIGCLCFIVQKLHAEKGTVHDTQTNTWCRMQILSLNVHTPRLTSPPANLCTPDGLKALTVVSWKTVLSPSSN